MGLFMFDDKSWKYEENNIEYGTQNFVIARKLFIKWLIQVSSNFWISKNISAQNIQLSINHMKIYFLEPWYIFIR